MFSPSIRGALTRVRYSVFAKRPENFGQCSVFSVQCSVFSVQCSVFGVRCSVFGIRYSVFDVCKDAKDTKDLKDNNNQATSNSV